MKFINVFIAYLRIIEEYHKQARTIFHNFTLWIKIENISKNWTVKEN